MSGGIELDFLWLLSRGAVAASRAAKHIQTEREGWRSSFGGHNRQPVSPRGVALMVSARVTEIDGWGNLVCSLAGILGMSPHPGEGLGMPFFFSSRVAHRVAPTRPPLYPALVFSRSIQGDAPLQCGCRLR